MPRPPLPRRRWLTGGIISLAALAALPLAAERLLDRQLRRAGFPAAELRLMELGTTRLSARLRLSANAPAGWIEVDYSLGSLLHGRIERLRLADLYLPLPAAGDDGDTSSPLTTLPVLPIDALVLDGIRLQLSRAGRDFELPLQQFEAVQSAQRWQLDGRIGAAATELSLRGVIGHLAGGLQGNVTLRSRDPAALARRIGLPLPLGGQLGAELTLQQPARAEPLSLALRIQGEQLSWGDWLQQGRLSAAARLLIDGSGLHRIEADPFGLEAHPGPALAPQLPPALAAAPLRLGLQALQPSTPLLRLNAGGDIDGLSAQFGLSFGNTGCGGHLELQRTADGLHVALNEADLGLADFGLAGRGLNLDIDIDRRAPHSVSGRLELAQLRSTRQPALHAPLRLSGPFSGTLDEQLALSLAADTTDGLRLMQLQLRHDTRHGRGELQLASEPLNFAETGLRATALWPAAGDYVSAARGTLTFKLHSGWGEAAGPDLAEIQLHDLDLALGAIRLYRINGRLRADRLWPLRVPAGQPITIAAVDAGLPLRDGRIEAELDDDRLRLRMARFRLLDGEVQVTPFTTRLGAPRHDFVLAAHGLDLGELFTLIALDGLHGRGRLDGALPLRLGRDGSLEIVDGQLHATAPGDLRYAPAEPPAFLSEGEAALALQALRNFHYQSLSMQLDGRSGGEMHVGLSLHGANPDFYGGHPVAFNLRLSGALAGLLQQGLDSYRLPEQIRERLERNGKTP